KQDDGTWLLNGTKLFITHGCGFADKPSVILTLARTGSPESGARGLSFFIVDGKDIQVAGIEKKMGIHCSPTSQIVYEDTPGILLGDEGYGLTKYAMGMMNTARLSIASQSLGIATAAYFEAKNYASQRVQFKSEIEKIPAVARMLDRMEREIAGMREILMEASRLLDAYLWKKEYMAEEGIPEKEIRKNPEIRYREKLADLFTPLVKYYLSETCISIASDAVQIHGGSGYTEDYDVSRIFRDSRITSIYEGTSQLQVVGGIGSVISGMSQTGNLRKYLSDFKKTFSFSEELLQVEKNLEEAVELYKEFKDDGAKDRLASEVVDIAVRLITGSLLERSLVKMNGDDLKNRKNLSAAYQIDSIAKTQASLLLLKYQAM
ncbi:MAG: acyl-CoA dehydrogenase family protein, partial [Spirochaetia bacterium]|nr:acyl-CoA dehydrogenase family protein [Spirochaetia bacterium]